MYILPYNPAARTNLNLHGELIGEVLKRLADSTEGLVFEPEEHKYTIAGQQIPSVSSIVERYAPFDRDKVAQECSRNPKSKYYRMNPEDIKRQWNETANAGTAVHAFGEACYLWTCGRADEIDEGFQKRITPEGLIAMSPKEEAVAKWWASNDWTRFVPVAKETMVFNPILRYAGTFDLLLYDTIEKAFIIRDYKTNDDLFKWYGKYLGGQFHKIIKNNDEGKYTLQQNLYSIQLRNIGVDVGGISLVWLREDSEWQEVAIPNMERLVYIEMLSSQTKQPELF